MRGLMWGALVGATALCGCGPSATDKKAAADARAADFTPPAVMSRVDFGTSMERRFRQLDRNADDRLTPDEMPRQHTRMMRLDRDGNGSISTTEFNEGTLKRFDAMDLNHDGTVTSEEHNAWRKTRPARVANAQAASGAGDADEDPVGDALANKTGGPD
jgi:hypothetical protein